MYPPQLVLAARAADVAARRRRGVPRRARHARARSALTLCVLEIRDVRCYAAALLWVPTISGVLLGNVSIPLAFALAVVWRYRDAVWPPAVALGLAVSAKLLLWPMFVWMLATRRLRTAALAVGDRRRRHARRVGAHRVRRARRVPGSPPAALGDPVRAELLDRRHGRDARARATASARRSTLLVGGGLLVGCVVFARRGDDERVVHVRGRGDAGASARSSGSTTSSSCSCRWRSCDRASRSSGCCPSCSG